MVCTPTAVRTCVRELQEGDYHKGYLSLLGQLSEVGDQSEQTFLAQLQEMRKRGADYYTAVIEDQDASKIIGTATIFIELKFQRSCSKVGHVEDVVVDSTYRGLKLGQRLIREVMQYAEKQGCYKVILDCSEANVPFYEKSGLKRKEVQMVKYF